MHTGIGNRRWLSIGLGDTLHSSTIASVLDQTPSIPVRTLHKTQAHLRSIKKTTAKASQHA